MKKVYLLLFSFCIFNLQAQVISTDLNILLDNVGTMSEFDLDINNDGTDDFTVQFQNINASSTYKAHLGSWDDNEVACPNYLNVTVFEDGDEIGPSTIGWHNPSDEIDPWGYFSWERLAYKFWPGGNTNGNFAHLSNKFVGVRFFDGGETYYGYIEVTCLPDPEPGFMEIVSMAYNSIPDSPIEAGEEGDGSIIYFLDNDGDGYGDPDESMASMNQPTGYVDNDSDCNDNDSSINPGEEENPYNGVDDDCDPDTLDDDLDEDGYGIDDDCDDMDDSINPGETEIPYNGIDEDCDEDTLDDDLDEDGWDLDEDCDDTNEDINPDEDEIPYNGIDDDCNENTVDDDLDGDGYDLDDDCDDTNEDINPGEEEIPYSGIDEDCDPDTLDDDLDQDGYGIADDCDDTMATINPGETEIPYNGIDEDCNPDTLDDDLDQDGYGIAEDCDDTIATINPGETEIPYNGIDEDCNPETLDDDLDQDGFSIDEDCDDMAADVNPDEVEIPYNGIDEDCNPETLDDDLDQDGFGIDEDCNDTDLAINPDAIDIPNNGVDEDCDGEDATTGVHEIDGIEISVFPNPASSFINIKSTRTFNYSLSIFNVSGELVFNQKNAAVIDVSNYVNGMYFIELINLENQKKLTDRILILD